MTISENLLLQMYSMMDSVKLPEMTPSEADKADSKSSFQDLMDQTRKDVSNSQKPENTQQDKTQPKDTKQTEKTPESEETEQPKLENTNYCAAAYFFRPEILPVVEEPTSQEMLSPVTLTETPVVTESIQPTFNTEEPILSQMQPQQTAAMAEETPDFQSQINAQSKATQTEITSQTVETATQFQVVEQEEAPQTETAFAQADSQEDTLDLSPEVTQMQQPLFRDVETAPVKVGETYELDTTSPEMDTDLAKIICDSAMEGVQKLQIQLTPEHLGKIVVELTQHTDGSLQVILQAADVKSSGLLTQHLDTLNTALQNLGQQVHVEVQRNQNSESAQQQPFQQADPDGHGQQQQQQQHKQSKNDSDDFLQQLRLGLFSMEETS